MGKKKEAEKRSEKEVRGQGKGEEYEQDTIRLL